MCVGDVPGLPGHSLFAVFDGHGGKLAAILAAQQLLEVLQQSPGYKEYAADQTKIPELGEGMRVSFLALDESMRKALGEDPNERSGCTAIAAMVTPTHVITSNAGDSRGLLSRGGANVEISFDHKPYDEKERSRIEQAGGVVHMKRVDGELAVSRALGDFQYKDTPDLSPEAFKVTANPDIDIQARTSADEFLVLACDGIFDVMTNEEVIERVTVYARDHGEGNPLLLAEELIEDCLVKGSRDNMSAIVVLFESGRGLVTAGKPGIMALRAAREEEERMVAAEQEKRNEAAAAARRGEAP